MVLFSRPKIHSFPPLKFEMLDDFFALTEEEKKEQKKLDKEIKQAEARKKAIESFKKDNIFESFKNFFKKEKLEDDEDYSEEDIAEMWNVEKARAEMDKSKDLKELQKIRQGQQKKKFDNKFLFSIKDMLNQINFTFTDINTTLNYDFHNLL